MVPNGQPPSMGSAQSVPPSLLQSNSGVFGAKDSRLPSQTAIPSLLSPHNQLTNMNMIGSVSNGPTVLNQSFGNEISNSGTPDPVASQHGGTDTGTGSDTLNTIANGMDFSASSSFASSNLANCGCSSAQLETQQVPNLLANRVLSDQQQILQISPQNLQHGQQQLSASQSNQQPLSQHQFLSTQGGFSATGKVKLEPQVNDHQGQQQFQSLSNLAPIKLEQQNIQNVRSLGPVKMEPQHSDQSLFLQQQQYLPSRQSPQAVPAQLHLLQQRHQKQRLFQLQQQRLLKQLTHQRPPLQQQKFPMRSPLKPTYEPGMCARRLTHYMDQQQHRPEDNNIEFWRKFVAEYFAPNAKKKWCVSMYGTGRQTTGVIPQDVWHCDMCNRRPGRGFEAIVEVLPRLFKIKYESGILEELLYVDMPHEYQSSSGQIVLDYAKAIQESVFEHLRVVRDGQLRIVFTPDLKIHSWEFCARRHEELIPRRLLVPQVTQLGTAAQKYQAANQDASSNISVSELQNNCNMFVTSARQLAKALEVPLVNDLGYTKRYVRCLQISEVVNCMKDLIDFSRTGTGPMESLAKIPRRDGASSKFHHSQALQSEEEQQQQQQSEQQVQQGAQNSIDDQNSAIKLASGNGIARVNNSFQTAALSTSASSVAGLLHQNSMNLGQQTPINSANSPLGGNSPQIPSPDSSGNIPQVQPSPLQSPTASSNNLPQQSHNEVTTRNHMSTSNTPANMSMQQPALSGEPDSSETQSSVQKIIHETMMSNQHDGAAGVASAGSLGNDVKSGNGALSMSNYVSVNGGNYQAGNGIMNVNSSIGASGFSNGMRAAMGNNSVMNGRIGMATLARDQSTNQQDLGNQFLSGLGAVNGYNNHQFDWKTTI